VTAQPAPTGGSYWSEADTRQLCAVEAADYIARLHAAVPVRATDRILDFGCGTGHAVQQLAAVVAAVGYWDAAEPMRRATAERTGRLGTVFPVDLADPARWAPTASSTCCWSTASCSTWAGTSCAGGCCAGARC
jgi:trans-aconitate methyltransferase